MIDVACPGLVQKSVALGRALVWSLVLATILLRCTMSPCARDPWENVRANLISTYHVGIYAKHRKNKENMRAHIHTYIHSLCLWLKLGEQGRMRLHISAPYIGWQMCRVIVILDVSIVEDM